jgi:hypothetical protein
VVHKVARAGTGLFPVAGQGCWRWNSRRAAGSRLIRPLASRSQLEHFSDVEDRVRPPRPACPFIEKAAPLPRPSVHVAHAGFTFEPALLRLLPYGRTAHLGNSSYELCGRRTDRKPRELSCQTRFHCNGMRSCR